MAPLVVLKQAVSTGLDTVDIQVYSAENISRHKDCQILNLLFFSKETSLTPTAAPPGIHPYFETKNSVSGCWEMQQPPPPLSCPQHKPAHHTTLSLLSTHLNIDLVRASTDTGTGTGTGCTVTRWGDDDDDDDDVSVVVETAASC